jgi:hypothetical protein
MAYFHSEIPIAAMLIAPLRLLVICTIFWNIERTQDGPPCIAHTSLRLSTCILLKRIHAYRPLEASASQALS